MTLETLLTDAYFHLLQQTESLAAASKAAAAEDTAAINRHLERAAKSAYLCSRTLMACTSLEEEASPPKGSALH